MSKRNKYLWVLFFNDGNNFYFAYHTRQIARFAKVRITQSWEKISYKNKIIGPFKYVKAE